MRCDTGQVTTLTTQTKADTLFPKKQQLHPLFVLSIATKTQLWIKISKKRLAITF